MTTDRARVILALAALAFVWSAVALAGEPITVAPKKLPKTDAAEITGVYLVKGTDATGKGYTGACHVTKIEEVYLFSYAVGATQTLGVGLRVGDVVSVGWRLDDKKFGSTLYKLSPNGFLRGRWVAVPTHGRVLTETLLPLHKEADE